MDSAQLNAMTLDELRRLAAARGVAGADQLDRPALVAALVGTHTSDGSRAGWAEPQHHVTPHGMPTSVLPARPSDYDSETMARVYLEQGLAERAVEIYRELVAARPHDTELATRLAEAERIAGENRKKAIRSPRRPSHAPPSPHEPFGMLDFEELPEAYNVDEVEVMFKDPYSVFAYWEITESGMEAARAHLGDEARDSQLVLRLFSTAAGGDPAHTRDYPVEEWRGRRYLPSPKAGVRLRAATGLVAPSGLFALIANSSLVRVPPAEPAPVDGAEWLEVKPARSRGLEKEPIEILRKVPPSEAPRALPGQAEAIAAASTHGEGPSSSAGGPTSPGAPSSPTSPGKWRPGESG